ncbi:DUF397 domain-containing protein [Streptomyces sp. NPDC053048]|uniref:DUF397 domain-containing protein n=1 Tax=Streptomyces sp. NPDC053048 TaxID=3365694 RepID=UPI0037D2CC8B
MNTASWRKSSYSGAGDETGQNNCVEVAIWHKSSYSNGGDEKGGGNCLEVADNIPGIVPVRDSKATHRPALLFPTQSWAAFVAHLSA